MQIDPKKMTVDDLSILFFEAAETERALPGAFRKQKMSSWPDYVQSWSAYGWSDVERVRVQPTADQVDRLDLALDLGLKLDAEDRKLIWAVAHSQVGRQRGPKWTKLAKMLGCSRHSVKAEYAAALVRLTWRIDDRRESQKHHARAMEYKTKKAALGGS